MKQNVNLRLELLFLLLAAVLTAVILLPIRQAGIEFPFYAKNMILIFVSVMWIKHIFLLKHSWINQFQKLKIALIPLSIPFIIALARMLNSFTAYIDEIALADLMLELPYEEQKFLIRYIRIEYVTVGVTAIVAAIILPFKLMISVWREVNRSS